MSNNQEVFNQVIEVMKRAELNPRVEEHLRVFLFSMIDEPKFQEIINLMTDQPELFDKFIRCFDLKVKFFEHGGDKNAWMYLLKQERDIISSLKK